MDDGDRPLHRRAWRIAELVTIVLLVGLLVVGCAVALWLTWVP